MDVMLAASSLPLWLAAFLLVIVPTAIAMCGPIVVRRLFTIDKVAANNEVAGFQFATLGVVYAVLLGLAVISVWEKFADAEAATTREAAALASMYRLSAGLDPASRQSLGEALTHYAQSAVADDWPAMAEGHQSLISLAALNRVYDATLAFTLVADDSRGAVLLEALLTQLDLVTEARRERLGLSEGIVPDVIWLVLFTGAALTLGFTFFFGLPNLTAQVLMTGILGLLIFLALFVALSIDHPFTGAVSVPADPIELVLKDFGIPPK